MQLLMVVAQPEDASSLTEALTQADYRSTRLDSVGGFLRQGMATVMIGIEAEQVQDVLRIVQETCHARTVLSQSLLPGKGASEVTVGGASVFVLDVSRFDKL